MSETKLAQARGKVEKPDLKGALLLLQEVRPNDSAIAGLLGRVNDLAERVNEGTMKEEDRKVTQNELIRSILSLIDKWEEEIRRSNAKQIGQNIAGTEGSSTKTDDMYQTIGNNHQDNPANLDNQKVGAMLHFLSSTQEQLNDLLPNSLYTAQVTRLLVSLEQEIGHFINHLVSSGNSGTKLYSTAKDALNKTKSSLKEIAEARRNLPMSESHEFVRNHVVPHLPHALEPLLSTINKLDTTKTNKFSLN